MARSDKRYSVYPSAAAVAEIGERSPDLNKAIDRYALLQELFRASEQSQEAIWTTLDIMLKAFRTGKNGT